MFWPASTESINRRKSPLAEAVEHPGRGCGSASGAALSPSNDGTTAAALSRR